MTGKDIDVTVIGEVNVAVYCAECGAELKYYRIRCFDNMIEVEVEPHNCQTETKK